MSLDDNIFHSNYGLLVLIHGPMFSGKTEALISALERAEKYAQLKVQAFKPRIDNRYGEDKITAHNSISFPAQEVDFSTQIYDFLDSQTKVIGIDEIQFFDEEIIDFCIKERAAGKIIIAEGLLSDYRRELFSFKKSNKTMGDLLIHANYVFQKTAFCKDCGKPALYTARKTPSKDIVLIGGKEDYFPACPEHYSLPNI